MPRRPAPSSRKEERRSKPSTVHVLLVDDAPDTRWMYGRYFEYSGLDVTTASDGMEALRSIDSRRPDVIVLDLAMPLITGWDVIRELRASPMTRAVPIIALSGQDATESALAAGADSYCAKPCTPADLLRLVLRLLRQKAAPGRSGH
jgi:CheY-like chemotaxis protein